MINLGYSGRRHLSPVQGAPALLLNHLSAGYPTEKEPALKDLHWQVKSGSCVALVGPNGAGKSTLLKVIAGLLPVRAGEIKIYGNPVGGCHHRVVYLPQRSEIDWHFPIDVQSFVLSGRYVHLGWLKNPQERDRQIAQEALKNLQIDDLSHRQIGQLSGGQQQRVLLARALAQEADLFLLDEPLNAIDTQTRHIVTDLLLDLKRRGKTVVVATHFLDNLVKEYDDALYLVEGIQKDDLDTHHSPGCNH